MHCWKKKGRTEEDGAACATECLQTSVFTFPVQYIWDSTHCCPDSTGQRGHWQHHTQLPLSARLQKQQFRLERKKEKKSSLSSHPKEAVSIFFFFFLGVGNGKWSQALLWQTHMHTQEQFHTQTHKSQLQLQRSGSGQPGFTDPNQRGYVGLQLPPSLPQNAFYLSMAPSSQVRTTPTDFTGEHSKGLLYPVPSQTNLFPLKAHTPRS